MPTLMILLSIISTELQAQNRSFIQEEIIKVEGVKQDSSIFQLSTGQKQVTRTYLDGLGRAIQQVAVKGSPLQKDMVQFSVYDNLGRQSKGYLPYVGSDGSGGFHANAVSEQAAYYANGATDKVADDTSPYSQQVFENSPLQRVMTSGSIGAGYQPSQHASSVAYRTNLSSETVRRWNPDGSAAANYAAGTLSVTIMTDAGGVKTLVYQDKAGRTLLKKQQLDGTISGASVSWLETCYVYDDLGQLRYAVPPKAMALMQSAGNYSLTQTALDKLLFRYSYDHKGRQTERTVPGGGVMYMVYDPLDRLVLAQDANLRVANKWNYIKYSNRGTAISQGLYTNTTYTTRATMQAYVSGLNYSTSYFEKRNTASATGYYTNVCFPTATIEPLAYSYYDDYDLDGNGTANYAYQAQGLTGEAAAITNTRGMLTMVRKRTVGTGLANIWLSSVIFYDKRGNAVQTQGNNHLNTALNNIKTVVPDFTGKTIKAKNTRIAASVTTTVLTSFSYDHSDRLTAIDEQLNGGSVLRVAAYEYNELGQLADKKLHSANSGSSYLQSVDFRYSIRGQVLSINNSSLGIDTKNDESGDVFGMEIMYEGVDAGLGNTAYFTGMISAVKWKSKTPSAPSPAERSYTFSYDKLYRLTGALYADRAGTGSWTSTGAYDEKNISYDHNGNILTLKRNAKISGAIAEIDNLNYTYTANQLNNITDGTTTAHTANGFRNLASSATAYSYNSDGSLTGDTKKGLALEYNVLNKTAKITMSGHTGRYITYSYDASGVLLRKQAYENNVLVKTTDYVEGFVYENNTLSHFGMAEGRVRNNSGTLKYEYMISDNMGNVRVSFEEVAGVATVRQENSYYPFGLIMPGGYAASQPNRNLYNAGSEWQDDFGNLPDYYQTHYRNYDAALGRFISVDPLAEASESMTSYHYALNNPVMFNDPMGDLARVAVEMSQRLGAVMHGGYGRIGSGSGNHWADGIHYSDWTAWGGSDTYRDGIASGLMDHGGYLYDRASGGYGQGGGKLFFSRASGEYGYYSFKGVQAAHTWDRSEMQAGNVYFTQSFGVHGTWNRVGGNANEGGVNLTEYLTVWGAQAAALENFSGVARFGGDLSIRTATASGKVFMGNQYVKTVSLAKAGKGLGIAGGIVGTGFGVVGVVNGQVHPGKFGADAVMTAVGIWGGPMGSGVSVIYSVIDAYYPGGVNGYGHDLGEEIYNMQQQNPGYRSQQMFP